MQICNILFKIKSSFVVTYIIIHRTTYDEILSYVAPALVANKDESDNKI